MPVLIAPLQADGAVVDIRIGWSFRVSGFNTRPRVSRVTAPSSASSSVAVQANQIVVVLNWADELRRSRLSK